MTDKHDAQDDGIAADENVDYRKKYRDLKRNLKILLHEQEQLHNDLSKIQKRCIRVSRDKSFLLDRLLQYEKPAQSSDDDITDYSGDEINEEEYGEAEEDDEIVNASENADDKKETVANEETPAE